MNIQQRYRNRPRCWGRCGGLTLAEFAPASVWTAHKQWGRRALVLLWLFALLLRLGQPSVMASPLPKPTADSSTPLGGGLAASARVIAAWGSSTYGRTTTPPNLIDVIAIAVGDNHNLALKKDGTVVVWGANDYGVHNVPSSSTNVIAIDAGNRYNLALRGDGTVVAWGNNNDGQSTVPVGLSRVKAIAAGGAHSLALKDDGTVVAWGNNYYGQTIVPAGLRDVKAIAAGENHSLALKIDGTVVAWGRNDSGQSTVPTGLTGVLEIDAGVSHSLARTTSTVVAWGDNSQGQLTIPTGINSSPIIDISAGSYYNLVLRGNRTIIAWGQNHAGQATVPFAANGAVAIAAGHDLSLAITLSLAMNPKDYPQFCLNLPNNAASNGAVVNLATCIENNGQRWMQGSDETIRPHDHSSYCLTLPNNSATNGALINLATCTAGNNAQKWIRNADETFRPKDHPSYCLNLPNNAASDGAVVNLASCTVGSNAQKWSRSPLAPWFSALKSVGTLRPLDHRGFCLQAPYDIPINTVVKLWQCDGSSYQRWVHFADGTIRPTNWNNLWCLAGTHPLSIQNCNGLISQKWFSDGHRTLRTKGNPNGCMDLQNNQASNGAFVGRLACSNWRSQVWSVGPTSGGVAAAGVADSATLTATQPLSSTLPTQPAPSAQNERLFLPLVANNSTMTTSDDANAGAPAAPVTEAAPQNASVTTTVATTLTLTAVDPNAGGGALGASQPVTTTAPAAVITNSAPVAVEAAPPIIESAPAAIEVAPVVTESEPISIPTIVEVAAVVTESVPVVEALPAVTDTLLLTTTQPITTDAATANPLAGTAVGNQGGLVVLALVGLAVIGSLFWQRRRSRTS